MSGSEKPTRKSRRYPVAAKVSFWWKDEDGNQRQGDGTSRDISETGAFVFSTACPSIGADVELRIFLAPLADAMGAARMELEGRVLRVEQTTGGTVNGFAVSSHVVTLRERDESAGEGNPGGSERTSD